MIKTKKEKLIDSLAQIRAKVDSAGHGYDPTITDETWEELSNGKGDDEDDYIEIEPGHDPEP